MASSKKNYDVFLSFRGPDVRNNFLSHLYAALDQNGIHTFVDSEELKKGEQISPTLVRAIEESCIAIIIFSEDYASSRWCLEELAKIMEYKAQNGLIVLPVFYKVEPREVRRAYKRTMAKHETEFGKDSKTVEGWKKALHEAGSLSGWHINDEDEAKIIRGIVKQASSHLERTTPLHVAEYPVGIDSRVQEVISLSQKELDGDDVLMIGLWGPGGIGKTTLAKAIYNAIEGQFEGSSFLDRVRETSNKSDGLVDLQRKLLYQILSPNHLTIYSKDEGINLIRKRLHSMKVLLILDDVDQEDQLKALAAGGGDWFGKGSRIFVTTRDQHLLTSSRCKSCVYQVRPLDHDEALELFLWHVFPNSKKSEIRKDLIGRALRYASRLPLALQVLGSLLCGREELVWESALHNLSKSPDKTINRVLKISFEGLENNEREIFLDIACFFEGKSIEYIKKVLNNCYDFDTTIVIDILIERSLITKDYHETLQMHDLVQLMGKDIVNQECLDDPGKRSRLWLFEEVLDILQGDTEMNAVKAIVLDLRKPKEISISPNVFTNMKMLRLLILLGVRISSQDPIRLPNNLRLLEWPNAPYLEFGSNPKKLVGLDVRFSHVRHLGDKFENFRKLKYINFSYCKSLVSVPDLSLVPTLESLNLEGCTSLVELHQSVAYLNNLKLLSLHSCSNLNVFPNTLNAKSLETLDLFGCSKLENFPDILRKMEHLEELNLGRTAIKELPTSIENLLSMKKMHLRNCKNLAKLPSSIYKLQNLEHLSLQGCSNLVMFPKEDSADPNGNSGFSNLHHLELGGCNLSEVEFLNCSSSFPKLGHLDLSENKFTHLPTCITKYDALEHLVVDKCKQLQKIPQLPPNLHRLRARSCRSLQEWLDLSALSSNGLDVDFSLCRELFRKRANIADVLSLHELFRKMANIADVLSPKEFPKRRSVDISLSGREMLECFHRCKDGSISFMVPGDLSNKFLGLALCFVLRSTEGKAVFGGWCVGIEVAVNNYPGRSYGLRKFLSIKSDLLWIKYIPRSELLIEGELPRDDWSHIKVRLDVPKGRLIKWGFRLINEQQEDDLRIKLQDNQPIETNRSPEERDSEEDNWMSDVEEESSWKTDEFWEEKRYSGRSTAGCGASETCRSYDLKRKLFLGSSYRIRK